MTNFHFERRFFCFSDGFGLRILGGEEEKSQVSVGRIVPNSPAAFDGRLQPGDEIVQIDGHSTSHATHDRVVQLMQQARENQHVCLVIRRYHRNPPSRFPFESNPNENEIRFVTLQKNHENQSFGFVIISSQGRTGATVGKTINNEHYFRFSIFDFVFKRKNHRQ